MNSNYYFTQLTNLEKEQSRIQSDIAKIDKDYSDAEKAIQDANKAALSTRSESIRKSKFQTIRTKQTKQQELLKKKAALQKKYSECIKKIAKSREDLGKAQKAENEKFTREQSRLLNQQKSELDVQKQITDDLRTQLDEQSGKLNMLLSHFYSIDTNMSSSEVVSKEYDFFISHASEDKEDFVRDLAEALSLKNFKVWYDESELMIGDSLRKKIDDGLSRCKFGIVVISPNFVQKRWTEYELNGMVAREMNGQSLILPIWHNISMDQVLKYSPSLADKKALKTSDFTIDQIVEALATRLSKGV